MLLMTEASPLVRTSTSFMKASVWVGKSQSSFKVLPSKVLWLMWPSMPIRSQLPLAITDSSFMSIS